MFLGFFIIFLLSITEEGSNFKYTLSINPLYFTTIYGGESYYVPIIIPAPAPGVNFELKSKGNLSLNFEMNMLLIIPVEVEIGIREYLQKKKNFQGFYFYQGIAVGWILFPVFPEGFLPSIILTAGYKSIREGGFTLDPFFGVKAFYKAFSGKSEEERRVDIKGIVNISSFFIIIPAIGLYLGYSW
jgi:hypothetical protein